LGGSDTETKSGYIQVSTLNISGSAIYWSGDKPIPDAVCTLTGDNTLSDTTDENGQYIIAGIPAGSYVLTPVKQNHFNGITAYDAALVLRHVADIAPLTGYQALAADVNQSGEISSLDASYILQKSVGLIETFPDTPSMWIFDPTSYTYPSLLEDQINQDFTAILLGDPTGNWEIDGAIMGSIAEDQPVNLTIFADPPDAEGKVTATIYLDPNVNELYGLDLVLTYDHTHAEILSVIKGAIGDNWFFAANTSQPGLIRLGIADTQYMQEMSSIAVVEFQLNDLNLSSEFVPEEASVNEGAVPIVMTGTTLGAKSFKIFVPIIVK